MYSDILYSISTAIINTNDLPLISSWSQVNTKTYAFTKVAFKQLCYLSKRAKRFDLPISHEEFHADRVKWETQYKIKPMDLVVFNNNVCSIIDNTTSMISRDRNIKIWIPHKRADPFNINYWDIEGDITITPIYELDTEFIQEIKKNAALIPNNRAGLTYSYFINNEIKTHLYYYAYNIGIDKYNFVNNKSINHDVKRFRVEYALYQRPG
jgi:hypothetical protein